MRAMSRLVLVALSFLVLAPSLALGEMTRERKNLVGGELLGRGLFLTGNYERYLTDVVSAGVGAFGLSSEDGAFFVLPLYAALTLGDPHSLYLSGGVTIFGGADFDAPGDNTESASTGVIVVGYQYMSESGFYVRPAMNFLTEFTVTWPGIAIGGAF